MANEITLNRRQMIRLSAGAAAGLIIASTATAQETALSESDPTALALGYVEDATSVDTAKWPKRASLDGDAQFCNNCSLYRPIDDVWGGCSIFPGKKVKGAGWCNAWIGS